MDPLRLTPADATALRTAFAHKDRDGAIAARGDEVILDGRRLAMPKGKGAPERPAVAGDGSRAAWIRDGSVEVVDVKSGFASKLRQLATWHAITPMRPALAVDLSQDGATLAYLSEDRLHLQTGEQHRFFDLPAKPADLECLPGGRTAVETQYGTYLLVDEQGQAEPLPLAAFDPEGAAARRRSAEAALPDLAATELDTLLEDFGTALRGAQASPDGRRVALQVADRHLLLDRRTGQRTELGRGPGTPPSWSPDGSFLAADLHEGAFVLRGAERSRPLPGPAAGARFDADGRGLTLRDGRHVALDQVFDGWTLDMGTGLLRTGGDDLQVVVRDNTVQIGAVRLEQR